MPGPNLRGAEFWNGAMGHAWISQQEVISDVFAAVTRFSLGAAAPRSGEHVIDVGCGTGDTLLAFARIVGPSGAVPGVDVSAPVLGFAKDRSADAGFCNVSCALADATTYGFEPRWADLVYSRFGVMFFDEPVKAFANIRCGMKESGRLAFVCFRTMSESPWFHVPIAAARPHLPPQPGGAGDVLVRAEGSRARHPSRSRLPENRDRGCGRADPRQGHCAKHGLHHASRAAASAASECLVRATSARHRRSSRRVSGKSRSGWEGPTCRAVAGIGVGPAATLMSPSAQADHNVMLALQVNRTGAMRAPNAAFGPKLT